MHHKNTPSMTLYRCSYISLRTVYYSIIYCANLNLKTVKVNKSSDIKQMKAFNSELLFSCTSGSEAE